MTFKGPATGGELTYTVDEEAPAKARKGNCSICGPFLEEDNLSTRQAR